jgi:hypothetical protein
VVPSQRVATHVTQVITRRGADMNTATIETIKAGLGIANKGNIFWSKRDACQALSVMHANVNRLIKGV